MINYTGRKRAVGGWEQGWRGGSWGAWATGEGGQRYYKYRGYSDFGVHAATRRGRGCHYVACLGDFSRTPCIYAESVSPSDWNLERRSLEYVNVNIGKRVADILSKRSGDEKKIDKNCQSISIQFQFFIASVCLIKKSAF